MNIPSEAVQNLLRLGYSDQEAQFIYIVAIHSGYFTDRQFLLYSGSRPGRHAAKFLAKLLARGHATYHRYANDDRVYHLFSRKILAAIASDRLPTRSRHQVGYIKTRLITLDFVLGNLDCQYLESETRKVEFFQKTLHIDESLLPSKVYRSGRGQKPAVRYFVDHFPIFLRGSSSPLLSFTYVDAGAQTLQGFRTHLESYAALLRSSPRFEFLYLAPTTRFFRTAQVQFSRIVWGRQVAPSTELLTRYFRLRKRWESGERVAASDVVFLNETEEEITSADVERQYAEWIAGRLRDEDLGATGGSTATAVEASFRPQQCGASLSVFHPWPTDDGRGAGDSPGSNPA